MTTADRSLLLTGATGFVGGAVRPALERAGWHVRCLTRNAARARDGEPALDCEPAIDWVQGDVGEPASCARALEGCIAALYLVHGIGEGADYHGREPGRVSLLKPALSEARFVCRLYRDERIV